MKILVIGAGAVGGYYGAKLTLAGHDVTLLARGKNLTALQQAPLQIKSFQGDFQTHVKVISTLEGYSSPDLILVTVKCYDTDQALEQIKPLVGKNTILLSLQNGVENEIKMSSLFGTERTIGGVCYIGAETLEPGLILHSANGTISIGELEGPVTPRIEEITKVFQEASVLVIPSDNILRTLWIKLGWNTSFNQICTIARTDVGHVLDHPALLQQVRDTYHEVFAVAKGHGVELGEDVLDMSLQFSENDLRTVRPSMLQDFENHRRLEHESFAGFLSREGKRLNIPTPINDTYYAFLSFLDSQK